MRFLILIIFCILCCFFSHLNLLANEINCLVGLDEVNTQNNKDRHLENKSREVFLNSKDAFRHYMFVNIFL